MTRLAAQARALAIRTGLCGAVAIELVAHRVGVGLTQAALEVGDDAFERMLLGDFACTRLTRSHEIAEANHLITRSVQDHLLHRFRQVLKWRVYVHVVVSGQGLENFEVIGIASVPPFDGTARQAQTWERDDALAVKHVGVPQAVTAGARPHGGVKGEQAWLQLTQRVGATGAGVLGTKEVLLAAVHFHGNGAVIGDVQSRFKALCEALLQVDTHL